MRRLRLRPTLLVSAGLLLAGAWNAAAFSQIGREDGTVPQQDGVIATPLPPLNPAGPPAGVAADDASGQPPNGTATPPTSSDPGASPPAAPSPGTQTPPPAVEPSPASPPAEQPDAAPGTVDGVAPPSPASDGDEEGTDPAASQRAMPEQPAGPPPDVVYGDNGLPTPVRDLRARLIEIAKSGDVEKLRPYIETGEDGTVLSFSGVEGDPIDFLKTASGDGDGVETLAILLEVLEAGHIKSEPGTDNEIYVWPYFSGLAVDTLTKPQKVELFELVTAGDYQEMVAFGAYNFYRVGISPDGKLQFFVAGD